MAGVAEFLPTNLAHLLNLDQSKGFHHVCLVLVLVACSPVWKDSGAKAGLVSKSPPGMWQALV